jgi:hypothetical protein
VKVDYSLFELDLDKESEDEELKRKSKLTTIEKYREFKKECESCQEKP